MLQEDLDLLNQWVKDLPRRAAPYAARPVQPTAGSDESETAWEKARRLGKAALAYGIVEPLAGVLDLPGALHLPGTEPGVWTKQAKEWEQGLGLKGTTGEAAAGLAGGLLGYLLPYGLAAKGLGAAGTALGVGRAGQMLGETAPIVTRAVEGYEALNPLVQTGIREGARGAAVWGLTEAGKPEEYRSSLGVFTASNVAGAVGFNLLGKLISKVRGSGVPHEEGAPGTQAREGSRSTLASLVAGIREGEPVRNTPSTDEVIVRPTEPTAPSVADVVQTTPPAATTPVTTPVTTRDVAPVDADLIAKAEALKRYWEGKTGTYRTTSQGLVTKTGESKTYTRVNEARAARNADMLDSILTALRSGQATDRQIEVLNAMWATRVKTKAGRAEMAALGYKPVEPAPELVVTPPKTKTQEELIKEADEEIRLLEESLNIAPDDQSVREIASRIRELNDFKRNALLAEATPAKKAQENVDWERFTADEEARLDRELNALLTRPAVATVQQPVSPDEAANSIRRAYEAVTQAHMKKYGLTEAPDQPLLATEVADEWGKQQGLKPDQARKQFRELVAKIMVQGTPEDISFGSVRDVKNSLGRVRIGDSDFQLGTVHVRKTVAPKILPELQAGDTVRYGGASFTVVDASDPTLLRLRSAAGDEFVLPRNMVEVLTKEQAKVPAPEAQTPTAESAPQSASALEEPRARRYSGAEYKHLAREARRILKEVSKEPEFAVHLQNKYKYISKADFLEADRVDRSGYIDDMATYGFVVDVTEGPNQRMIAPTEFVKATPKPLGEQKVTVLPAAEKPSFRESLEAAVPESVSSRLSDKTTPPMEHVIESVISKKVLTKPLEGMSVTRKLEAEADALREKYRQFNSAKMTTALTDARKQAYVSDQYVKELTAAYDKAYNSRLDFAITKFVEKADKDVPEYVNLVKAEIAIGRDLFRQLYVVGKELDAGKHLIDTSDKKKTVAASFKRLNEAITRLKKAAKTAETPKLEVVSTTTPAATTALPVWENVVPGTEAWARIVRENPQLKSELQARENEFWNGVASKLSPTGKSTAAAGETVYTDAIRKLPEVAKGWLTVPTVAKQLKSRGFKIGDPVDRVLDSVDVKSGATVDIRTLMDVPEVKNGEIALNVLKKAAEQRGATVVDNDHVVEMHAGIPLSVVARKIKLRLARNTKPTFTPVQDVSAARGSLPRNVMEKLPDDVRMGLEELDEDIALLNSRIKEHTVVYGNPAVMEPGAREKFDKMVAELDELAQKREAWREAVETELDDMAKRKYSYSVLNRLVKAKPIDDSIPVYDPDGNVMGWFFVTPFKGKRLFIPKTPEVTKLDEHIWRKQPTIYARYLGVMRDLFGEPIVAPLRNAMRMTQAFESEYQEWLYNIIKPIIRDKAARERVTYLLEGKEVKGATSTDRKVAAELREWYNDLFKKFGIDASRFLENYAPRIRQAGTIRDAFGTKPPKELTFFAEMERKADTPLFPRETDALIAASEYLRLGARKKFIQPAFDVVDQYKGNRLVFDKTGEVYFSEKAGRQIMHADRIRLLEEFKNSILRRPIWDERLMNGLVDTVGEALGKELGASKRKVLQEFNGFMTHAIYLNTIGLNPMTVLKQLTQQLLSVGTLSGNPAEGLWYWGKAVKALTTKPGRELLKYCWVLQSRVYQEGLEQQSKILAGIRRPVEKAAFYAFEQADKANVSISYMMKLMHSLKQGKPLSEAVEAANAFAADTQFLYGIDSPMFYKSPVGRLVGVLTSYPVNYFRLMYKHGLSKRTAMMGLMTMGASYALTTLTGLDFTNETPLGVAENFLPLSFVLSGTTGTGSIPLNIVRDTPRTITSKLSGMPLDSEEAWKDLQKDLTTLIPFPMVTLRRVVRAASAAQSGGKVYDEEGKLTYKMSPSEIRRSLIGPTVESRERRKEHAEVERAEQTYRYLRDAAVNAYLSGNKAEFNALQKTLIKRGLTPIRASDIKQAMRYRSMTALERHQKGLPKTYTAR